MAANLKVWRHIRNPTLSWDIFTWRTILPEIAPIQFETMVPWAFFDESRPNNKNSKMSSNIYGISFWSQKLNCELKASIHFVQLTAVCSKGDICKMFVYQTCEMLVLAAVIYCVIVNELFVSLKRWYFLKFHCTVHVKWHLQNKVFLLGL